MTPKTNVLFGAHPRGITHDSVHEIVRYRVSDNTILEPFKDVGNVERLIIKNRRLVAVGGRREGCWVAVFDLDSSKRIAEFTADFKKEFDKIESLFCSEVDNNLIYVLHGKDEKTISQLDIVKGEIIKDRSFEEMGSLKSISPNGKWLGSRSAAAAFNESTMQIGEVHKFSGESKIVSPPHFQHWAIREQGKAEGIPTTLSSRKNKYGLSSYAIHPSANLFVESCGIEENVRGKISYEYVIQFSNTQFENTIAKLAFDLPEYRKRRGYHNGQYVDSVEDSNTRMTVFDEEDKLAITTIGPNAFVVHLTAEILAAKPPAPVPPPPVVPQLVDSESGAVFAQPGEQISFDVSLTENSKARIYKSHNPQPMEFEKGKLTWRPTSADVGLHRLKFDAKVPESKKQLRHEVLVTVMPHYLDLKGRATRSAISCDGSTIAYLTENRDTKKKYIEVVDTQKRKLLQEIEVDFGWNYDKVIAVNKDYVFVLSSRRPGPIQRFEIKTGTEKVFTPAGIEDARYMYLDQLDRLVVSGQIPKLQLDRAFVFDAASLQPIKNDVRSGLLVSDSVQLPMLGAINDTLKQPINRRLVRHFGSIVDLDQNKFIALSRWTPRGAINFGLPRQNSDEVQIAVQGPLFPRWGDPFSSNSKIYPLPFAFRGMKSYKDKRQGAFESSVRVSEGANLAFTSLAGNKTTVIPSWEVKVRENRVLPEKNIPLTKENSMIEKIRRFPVGFDGVAEVFGRDVYLADGASSTMLFHQIPKSAVEKLRYPLTLVPPEVTQIKLGAKSTIDFEFIGDDLEAKFTLRAPYDHLKIDPETGVLTVDGMGIQNAWLDQNFALRTAKVALTERELERSLRKWESLRKDQLNHSKFIGVPVPKGFYPIRFTFTVLIKNTGKVPQPKASRDFANLGRSFDVNSDSDSVTLVGLIDEKIVFHEVNETRRVLKELRLKARDPAQR